MSQINKLQANCVKLIVIDIRPSVEYRDDVITIKLKEQSSIFFVFWEAWLKVPGKRLLRKPHFFNRYWVIWASLKLLRNDDVIKSKYRKISLISEKPLENYCHEVCLVFFYANRCRVTALLVWAKPPKLFFSLNTFNYKNCAPISPRVFDV